MLLATLLVWAPGELRAASGEYSATLEVSNPSPLLTEQVTVSLKLVFQGSRLNLVNPRFDIDVPDFGDHFQVLRQGRNNNMDLRLGGAMTVFDYVFVLKPLKEGSFTVDGATVRFNGESYAAEPVSIKVLPASTPPEQAAKENIFIDVSLSRNKPWKGEEFIATYKLYSRYELLQQLEDNPPTFDGFSVNNLTKAGDKRIRVERFAGQDYYTLELYRGQLYPLRDGEFKLPPYRVKMVASVPTGRKVRDFWGVRDEIRRTTLNLASPVARINVRDLPAGAPSDFNGAVGRFDLKSDLSGTETPAGEPLTLSLRISGDGNLKLIGEPKLELPPGFEAYEPRIKATGSSKTFEYLLIPGKPGTFTLDPFSFSYFDTREERYIRRESPVYDINVSPGSGVVGVTGAGTAGLGKEEVEKLGQDIRYLATELPPMGDGSLIAFRRPPYWVALALPFMLLPGLRWVAVRRRRSLADTGGRRNRAARKMATRRLRSAKTSAAAGDRKAFYDDLVRALWGYLSDRFGLEASGQSRDGIRTTLAERGLDAGLTAELIALLDRGEMALYAPAGGGSLDDDYQSAVALLEKLESATA